MDNLEVLFICTGENKNCVIYEPEEGGEIVSKLYVRKSAIGCKGANDAPQNITVILSDR